MKERLSGSTANCVNAVSMTRMPKKCIWKEGDIVCNIRLVSDLLFAVVFIINAEQSKSMWYFVSVADCIFHHCRKRWTQISRWKWSLASEPGRSKRKRWGSRCKRKSTGEDVKKRSAGGWRWGVMLFFLLQYVSIYTWAFWSLKYCNCSQALWRGHVLATYGGRAAPLGRKAQNAWWQLSTGSTWTSWSSWSEAWDAHSSTTRTSGKSWELLLLRKTLMNLPKHVVCVWGTVPFKKFGIGKIFDLLKSAFIQQRCITLIKSDSRDLNRRVGCFTCCFQTDPSCLK